MEQKRYHNPGVQMGASEFLETRHLAMDCQILYRVSEVNDIDSRLRLRSALLDLY